MKKRLENIYGHCDYCICFDEDCSMIYNLYIEENFRKKGHAKEFINEAIENIRKSGYKGYIKVVAEPEEGSISKEDLIKFYKKMGLTII